MPKCLLLVLLVLFILPATAFGEEKELNKWEVADRATVRLSPEELPALPENIKRELKKRGCTIPQPFPEAFPPATTHNVIHGEFFMPGQTDWAVLCSEERISSILIFINGSTEDVDEIARAEDYRFLQTIDEGRIGFSRLIGVSRKNETIVSQGIEDIFIEKGSDIYYFSKGKWLTAPGGD